MGAVTNKISIFLLLYSNLEVSFIMPYLHVLDASGRKEIAAGDRSWEIVP